MTITIYEVNGDNRRSRLYDRFTPRVLPQSPSCIALHDQVSGFFRYFHIISNICYLGCLYLFLIFDRFHLYSVFKVHLLYLLIQVGLSGLEPPTSRLSGVRSNRLSYKPQFTEQVHIR